MNVRPGAFDRATQLSIGFAGCLTVAFCAVFVRQAGILPTVIVGGSLVGGLVCWVLTTARYSGDPRLLVPVYSVTTALLMLHILEEYLFGFGPRIAELTGSTWSESEFVVMIVFILPGLWILCGALLYRRHPLGNWIMWFIGFGMVLGEPTHILVFPMRAPGALRLLPRNVDGSIPAGDRAVGDVDHAPRLPRGEVERSGGGGIVKTVWFAIASAGWSTAAGAHLVAVGDGTITDLMRPIGGWAIAAGVLLGGWLLGRDSAGSWRGWLTAVAVLAVSGALLSAPGHRLASAVATPALFGVGVCGRALVMMSRRTNLCTNEEVRDARS